MYNYVLNDRKGKFEYSKMEFVKGVEGFKKSEDDEQVAEEDEKDENEEEKKDEDIKEEGQTA